MFGYTVPLYSRLSPLDMSAYRRYYCETCHQLKAEFGLMSTSAVNYDMTFNTIIMNSIMNDSPDLESTAGSLFCVLNKPGTDSELFRKMAAYTILLTKWELVDDSLDKPSLKSNTVSLVLNRAISKAESLYPEYDEAVGNGFHVLREMESADCKDAALMGKTFGRSLSFALKDIAGEYSGNDLEDLFTSLTTAVYLMDAIDDLEDDFIDGTYNPLLAKSDVFINKDTFIEKNLYELSDSVNSVMTDLQISYSAVRKRMNFDRELADNIVYYGIPESAKNVMSGSSTAKATLKNIFDGHKKRTASY